MKSILFVILILLSGISSIASLTAEEVELDFFQDQDRLRESRNLQLQVGIYPNIQSVGVVYNINKYISLGGFYQKDYNFKMDKLYSTKDWAKDSIYFVNGDTYIYGASRAKIDWSGPQTFLNMKIFPYPKIPVYLSANVGRDIVGDRADHNVLLSYNATDKNWVVGHPIWMRQDGTPYWFRTVGLGTLIHLPYGFYLDAQYSRGMYTNYTRTMHIANDERILALNGFRVTEDGQLVDNGNAVMTPEDVAVSTYLMDVRHRERGHSGPHVIYGVWLGYSFGI